MSILCDETLYELRFWWKKKFENTTPILSKKLPFKFKL